MRGVDLPRRSLKRRVERGSDGSALKAAARLMMAMGGALLFLAVVIRLAPLTHANLVGDDLAIMASAAVIVVGALFYRYSR